MAKPKESVHRLPHISHLDLISAQRNLNITDSPALAKVERLLFVVNVGTWMLDLSRLDYLDTAKTLRS
jgi:hypothetical protein